MTINVLDVGCGSRTYHRDYFLKGENVLHIDISRQTIIKDGYKIINDMDILCDVQYLPFRSSKFNMVYASNLLEHVSHPYKALAEMKRVSKSHVIIKVPDASHHKASFEDSDHIFSWNQMTFKNLLMRFFPHVTIQNTNRLPEIEDRQDNWRTLKLLLLSIIIGSNELTATCRKEGVK